LQPNALRRPEEIKQAASKLATPIKTALFKFDCKPTAVLMKAEAQGVIVKNKWAHKESFMIQLDTALAKKFEDICKASKWLQVGEVWKCYDRSGI
jgi:hypothetical protein